jgi:hypothetical protein
MVDERKLYWNLKKMIRDERSMKDILECLCKIREEDKWDWMTKPVKDAPVHVAAYFQRWDLMEYFMNYPSNVINPYHKNHYGETIIDILKKHEDDMANYYLRKCMELRDKHFCVNCHWVLMLGGFCKDCHQVQGSKQRNRFKV